MQDDKIDYSIVGDAAATLGVILAGGRSRRMGGKDKAGVLLGGRPLLAHALARLRGQCGGLVINANGDPARFAAFGAPVEPDDVSGFAGPLAGVLAGLERARTDGFAFVITAPVDTPFIPDDLVARLHGARRAEDADIAVAASGGRMHHVVALWPAALAAELRRALTVEGLRKVQEVAGRYQRATAQWPTEPFDPFANVNTPDDLATAEAILSRSG